MSSLAVNSLNASSICLTVVSVAYNDIKLRVIQILISKRTGCYHLTKSEYLKAKAHAMK